MDNRKRSFEGDSSSILPSSSSPSSSFEPCAKAARRSQEDEDSKISHHDNNLYNDFNEVTNNCPTTSSSSVHVSTKPRAKDDNNVISLLDESYDATIINQLCEESDIDDDEIEFVKETKSKKRVHFSEIEHEIFYFKQPQFAASPSMSAIDEQASVNSSGIRQSSAQSSHCASSRATADYTVLSSNHGRARRQLRKISKHDLKAAVKYGQRLPAHPNRNTGEPRWKIIHNGLVYITDHSMRREITSYREEIHIEKYPISIQMMEHHTELKRILKEEPYLCTGHTYIIVDQSGSMRESDVDGFRSRSHAAYGTLSLEFLAEQLSSRPNPQDLFAESVTVVEMREEGEVVFDSEPFDWILFNRLLKRPNISRPSFGGNYNKSLEMISQMIQKEHSNLLSDGVEHGDLPNFSLVFLSDGKPSDTTPAKNVKERASILTSLSVSLKDKFSLFALGVGNREAEFEQLQLMVDTVTKNGSNGQFVHAGISTVKLANTFSQISNTLTSVRTTLLDSALPNPNTKMPKVAKDIEQRETGKIVGKTMPSQKYTRKTHTITRYRFDKDRSKSNPWQAVDLATHGANGVEVETKFFGKGSERLAFRFHELANQKRVGRMLVAKNSVHLNENETKESFHHDFCHVQSTAYDLAEKFNTAVRNAPLLQSTFLPTNREYYTKPPELKFMLCHVYSIKNNTTGEKTDYLVERMLQGKFTKYNSNNGYVRGEKKDTAHNTRTIELKAGKVKLEEFVQAFSHWVYEHSNKHMIVCDLQGVLNQESRYPEFMLTDPAICTRKGRRFGKTDMGLNGIRRFCSTHKCGAVCKGLGLSYINKLDS